MQERKKAKEQERKKSRIHRRLNEHNDGRIPGTPTKRSSPLQYISPSLLVQFQTCAPLAEISAGQLTLKAALHDDA
eukprot:751101-Hanusia_phi.AAC.1